MTDAQREQAACRGKPTRWWFAISVTDRRYWYAGEWWRHALASMALDVCARCPVAEACRDEAVAHRDWHGIRGGLTPPELRRIHVCRGCSEPFEPHDVAQRYCSMTCSERARRGAHVNERVA